MRRLLNILVDLLVVYGSILLSYYILGETLINYQNNLQAFYILAPLIGIFYLIFMYAYGLYTQTRRKMGDIFYTVFLVSISLMFAIMAACFFIRGAAMAFPRSVISLSSLLIFVLLSAWRVALWKIARKRHGVRKTIVIGPEAKQLASVLDTKYSEIYKVHHICNEDDPNLDKYITESQGVFLTARISQKVRNQVLKLTIEQKKGIFFVPDYEDLSIMSSSFQKTDDIPTFYLSSIGLTLEERFVKRLLDLVLGTIGFIIALPIGFIIALLVKLDRGPIFYAQERLTRDGKIFKVLKFRTMIPDAEKLSGPMLAGDKDPRITKVGNFIRAIRMDELPQIINILRGDMSIVGPRPERPFFAEQFESYIPQYPQRLKVKAGLTGLAQVEGKYNTTAENKLRYDLLYINNYSLMQDILIILQTVKILFIKESTEGVNS